HFGVSSLALAILASLTLEVSKLARNQKRVGAYAHCRSLLSLLWRPHRRKAMRAPKVEFPRASTNPLEASIVEMRRRGPCTYKGIARKNHNSGTTKPPVWSYPG